jgi:hypothetical protein
VHAPVFHYPWRIQAHVTIAVLALLVERIVEIRAKETWRNVAARLASIEVVEYDRGELRLGDPLSCKRSGPAFSRRRMSIRRPDEQGEDGERRCDSHWVRLLCVDTCVATAAPSDGIAHTTAGGVRSLGPGPGPGPASPPKSSGSVASSMAWSRPASWS